MNIMIKRIKIYTAIVVFCLQFLACGKKGLEFQMVQQALPKEGEESVWEEASRPDETGDSISSKDGSQGNTVAAFEATEAEEAGETKKELLSVHVCGAVNHPSVYQTEEGTRIYRLIEMAGGFTQEAAKDYLNLAMEVTDGMQIRVPTKEEVKNNPPTALTGPEVVSQEEGKVDINKADEAALCTLPGIGESRAKSIIRYREEHGGFKEARDIMNVSGIKEAAYEKIKDYIVVSK